MKAFVPECLHFQFEKSLRTGITTHSNISVTSTIQSWHVSEATAKYFVFEVTYLFVSHRELNLVVLPLGYAFALASGSDKLR